jgi:hypothetical protein
MLQVRNDINYVVVYNNSEIKLNNEIIKVPKINMQIPGDHILFDAHIAFAV